MASSERVCNKFTPHPMRNLCKECRNPREVHAMDEEDTAGVVSTVESLAADAGSQAPKSNNVYAWIPLECPEDRLDEYFKTFSAEKVPKYNSEGYKWRLKQLLKQIPPSDIIETESRFVEEEFVEDFKAHIQNVRSNALHFGHVKVWHTGMPLQCPTCLILLQKDELVVVPVEVSAQAYHPACFVCVVCRERLADLINCFVANGKIYCVRHFSEAQKKRCHACDELIFTQRLSQAGDTFYHKNHLRCFHCDDLLENERGFGKDGELYCKDCYQEMFCNDCEKCEQRITLDSRHVVYKDQFWHYNCFTCENCNDVITDLQEHAGKIYCLECYDKNFAPKCKKCKEPFDGQTKLVEYEGNTYHADCFKCTNCKSNIGSGIFVPHGGLVYCKSCNLREFGVRCYKCRLTITEDEGVTFNKQPYHMDCFTCNRCLMPMEEQQFKQVDNKIFCLRCFGDAFCKTCHSCAQPIVLGENEVRYSHGDDSWHAACFHCHVCKGSLVDAPFSIRGSTLVCQNCVTVEDDDSMRSVSKARMSRYDLPSMKGRSNSIMSSQEKISPEEVQKSTQERSPERAVSPRRSRMRERRTSKYPTSDASKERRTDK